MTLGERLSMYRKNNGMTQQELGERLNISAQAVSKWENDLSEPDIATIKKLSELYQVSITEILDIEEPKVEEQVEERPVLTEENVNEMTSKITGAVIGEMNNAPKALGFCTSCGITVTEENLGEKEPKVLCAHCLDEKKEEELRQQRALEHQEEERIRTESYNKKRMRFKRNASIITGLAIGIVLAIITIMGFDSVGAGIGAGLVFGYMGFAFTAQMFFDGVVRNVLFDLAEKSIHFPGLIFTFDIDGFLWLIGMKILFGILGFLGAILFAILGFVVAFVIAPFVYPFSLIRQNKAIRECDLVDFDMY